MKENVWYSGGQNNITEVLNLEGVAQSKVPQQKQCKDHHASPNLKIFN